MTDQTPRTEGLTYPAITIDRELLGWALERVAEPQCSHDDHHSEPFIGDLWDALVAEVTEYRALLEKSR